MRSESGRPPARCPWTLLLGSGPLLDHARPYLELAVQRVVDDPPQAVEQLESWAALDYTFPNRGKIALDGASIMERDRGLIEVFLDRHPRFINVMSPPLSLSLSLPSPSARCSSTPALFSS